MAKPTVHQPRLTLVGDDDLDLLESLKAALVEEADFRVLTTAVPDLVVPLVEATLPAVLVLDIALPNRSGWEVLTALHQHPRFRTLPALIGSLMPDAQARVVHLACSLRGVPGKAGGPGDPAAAGAGTGGAPPADLRQRTCS